MALKRIRSVIKYCVNKCHSNKKLREKKPQENIIEIQKQKELINHLEYMRDIIEFINDNKLSKINHEHMGYPTNLMYSIYGIERANPYSDYIRIDKEKTDAEIKEFLSLLITNNKFACLLDGDLDIDSYNYIIKYLGFNFRGENIASYDFGIDRNLINGYHFQNYGDFNFRYTGCCTRGNYITGIRFSNKRKFYQ